MRPRLVSFVLRVTQSSGKITRSPHPVARLDPDLWLSPPRDIASKSQRKFPTSSSDIKFVRGKGKRGCRCFGIDMQLLVV
jgi:hypothetical protein